MVGEGGGAAVTECEVDGRGRGVEGCGADEELIGGVVATVDFHVGFGGDEIAVVGVDGVGCGGFVGAEDGEVVGEEGGAVDVEEVGGWGVGGEELRWGGGGGGGDGGELVVSVRGFVGDGGWGGTPDLGRGVLGRSVGGEFGSRGWLLRAVHFGVGKGWSQTISAFWTVVARPMTVRGMDSEGSDGDV